MVGFSLYHTYSSLLIQVSQALHDQQYLHPQPEPPQSQQLYNSLQVNLSTEFSHAGNFCGMIAVISLGFDSSVFMFYVPIK